MKYRDTRPQDEDTFPWGKEKSKRESNRKLSTEKKNKRQQYEDEDYDE